MVASMLITLGDAWIVIYIEVVACAYLLQPNVTGVIPSASELFQQSNRHCCPVRLRGYSIYIRQYKLDIVATYVVAWK